VPQPRKSQTSARKASAGKPNARRPAARKVPATPEPELGEPELGEPGEDALRAALTLVRDMLARGIVITADRLQETVDEAVKRGRMTRDDAEELVANLVHVGRLQTQDTMAEIEGLVERSATHTRRAARERVGRVAAAARHAPGTDRALRAVDRARRAAGLGSPFPISGYDELTAAQVKGRLGDLTAAELRKVRDHERRNANRKSVLAAIEKRLV
jgi:polyhydroxyalkanoate synthesis regulator phasin